MARTKANSAETFRAANQTKVAASARSEDSRVLQSLLVWYPEFLEKNLHWQPGPENETPDFIGTSNNGKRFGLELTEWLDKRQTGVSISNQEARFKLLNGINSEGLSCPEPLTQVLICDRLDVPFRKTDLQNYSRELHDLIAYSAPRWKDNQVWGIWNVKDLASYRTLSRYCVCIVFYVTCPQNPYR
jgi:hypothetical protein